MDVPDAALAIIARSARGSFRDAISTLDQLAAASDGPIGVQDVLQLLGTVEEEALFRICDLIVDRDTAGLLGVVEELAEQGQDLNRLVGDLLEHLRHLLLVQHTGDVPRSLMVTEETQSRLREQANQLPEPDVIRLIDLLAVAVEDARQGGDPRLPLELALVKVTRPGADLSRESISYRLERLEAGRQAVPVVEAAAEQAGDVDAVSSAAPAEPLSPPAEGQAPPLDLEQLQHQWRQTVLPAIQARSIPTATMLAEARPAELAGDRLVVEFPPHASFHRSLAEEPKNTALLADALYEVTGRRLALAFALGEPEAGQEPVQDEPEGEEAFLSLLRDELGAREVEE
jgi:DNA polymerase III gamma/tau subunit